MSNLGDSNTPIEGESFGLPAGAQLAEDSGDLVIQDSGGTIILRRNETAGEWQFENTDLTGVNSLDASSLSVTNEATLGSIGGSPTGELADPQPSQAQDSGTDVVQATTLNFRTALNVSDDGGVARVDVNTGALEANIPNWEQDPNSPVSVTGANSISISLANSYEHLLCFIKASNNANFVPAVRLNNDTGANYNYRRLDGTEVVGNDRIRIGVLESPTNESVAFDVTGTFGSEAKIGQPRPVGNYQSVAEAGDNANITSPITDIEVFDVAGNNPDMTLEVFGRVIGA